MNRECRTTVSFIEYDGKDEDTVYEQGEEFFRLAVGGLLFVPKLTIVEEQHRGELIHGLERWLDERC